MPQGQAPERIEPRSLGDYLEVMCKAIFQAGISWRVVESKWPELREAFRGFDADTIANLNEAELDDLTSDRRVIRNRRKIEAVVQTPAKCSSWRRAPEASETTCARTTVSTRP